MSRNPRLISDRGGQLIKSSGVANMGAGVQSKALILNPYRMCTLHILVDNTDAVGVLYGRESNDPTLALTSWVNVVFTDGTESIAVASGVDIVATRHIISGCRYIELFYDRTSGDGKLDLYVTKVTKP